MFCALLINIPYSWNWRDSDELCSKECPLHPFHYILLKLTVTLGKPGKVWYRVWVEMGCGKTSSPLKRLNRARNLTTFSKNCGFLCILCTPTYFSPRLSLSVYFYLYIPLIFFSTSSSLYLLQFLSLSFSLPPSLFHSIPSSLSIPLFISLYNSPLSPTENFLYIKFGFFILTVEY